MDLSICIATLNACGTLRDCLDSLARFSPNLSYEILLADNGSGDDTLQVLAECYPQVQVLALGQNLGFGVANNRLFERAQGKFLLALNPDTILHEDVFTAQVAYLRAHPQVGLCIPKVLNRDGTFQAQCRRGDARPIEVFGYFFGLGKLFPRNRALNGYLQNFLPVDEIAEVPAISGSCMFIRRAVWEQIGGFDEQFFAYQEDSDLCLRAREAGWLVMYLPITQITHLGGEGGSKANALHSIYQWHRSYYLYYRKHFAHEHNFLFNGLYYALMAAKYLIALVQYHLRRLFKSGQKTR